MPVRRLLLFAILTLGPGAPAPAPAASLKAVGPDGRERVQELPRTRLGPALDVQSRYQAAYYYALAQLAVQHGLVAEAEALLERAQAADAASPLLARERGELLEALGRDAQAAVQLDQALAAEPGDFELRRRLARAYVRLGKLDLARGLFVGPDGAEPAEPEALRALVGLDLGLGDLAGAERRLRALLQAGGNADDRELLAVLLQRQGRLDEAAQAYRQVLALEPGRGTAWARLAASLEAGGDTAAALRALEGGLQALPDSALLADLLGRLSYRLGLYDRSEDAFGRVLEEDPTDADSLLHRGLARLKLRRYAEAEQDFQALAGLRGDAPGQWYGLALALILQKKYGPAEAALKKVLELNPKAEPAWVQMAFLHERQGRLDRAVEALRQGLKALPASEELILLLAAAYEQQGRRPAAVDLLRQAVRKGAGEAVRFQLAVSLDKGGDFRQAEAVLQALIQDAPQHAQALNYLGYSWAERKERLPEAEALIRRALEVDPDNHYYLDSLGWALHQQGRYAEAEPLLARAAAAIPSDADAEEAVVLDHLAETRQALGRLEEAAEARARAQALREAAKATAGGAP